MSGPASGIAVAVVHQVAHTAAAARPAGRRDGTGGNPTAVKPRRVSSATASASPSAICIVVLVVGASPIGQASAAGGSSSATSAACASVEPGRAVIATSGRPKRRACATRSASSAVSPELDSASTASPATIMPRSPCDASAGWTNKRRRAGGGEGRGDLARDMAGLAHAGHHDAPGAAGQQVDRAGEPPSSEAASARRPAASVRQHGARHVEVADRAIARLRTAPSCLRAGRSRRERSSTKSAP